MAHVGIATVVDNSDQVLFFPETVIEEKKLDEYKPITLEAYVREYFADEPILVEIAKCESTFRHFDKDGSVLRGKINKSDIGIMQINEFYHGNQAKELGLDLYSLEGNLIFAKYLYEKYGVQPWQSSASCWKKSETS
jgi:hypothetical protein